MNQRHYVSGRRSALGPVLFATGIVLLAVVGGALLLHATDVIELPFLVDKKPPPVAKLDPRGKVKLAINLRPLEAYSALQPTDLLDPRTRQIAVIWFPEALLSEDAIRYEDTAKFYGRVLRFDKAAGQFFNESMFYPPDTKPGPAAGVPPGMRALRLSTKSVPGLHGLRQGDRFDIVMTVEVQVQEPRRARASKGGVTVEGPYAGLAGESSGPTAADMPRVKRKRADVRVVVSNGLLVKPVHHRAAVKSGTGAVPGGSSSKKPIEELIIALQPAEVSELNHALAIDAQLSVAIRSGQATADGSKVPDGEIPDKVVEIKVPEPTEDGDAMKPRVGLIEVITGAKKRIEAVPEGSGKGGAKKDDE